MSTLLLPALTQDLVSNVQRLEQQLQESTATTFSPQSLPPGIQASRTSIIAAAQAVIDVLQSPPERVMQQIQKFHDLGVLRVMSQYKIFQAVPLLGGATYAQISRTVNLSESILRRIFRHAFTFGFFIPVSPDAVQHSTLSATVIETPLLLESMGVMLNYGFPAAASLADVLSKYPDSQEPTETSVNVAKDIKEPILDHWSTDAERSMMFSRFMKSIALKPGLKMDFVAQGFDWESLGEAVVVDAGGSSGHASLAIARQHPKLNFVVQDFPACEKSFNETIPTELKQKQMTFMGHNFFDVQPTELLNGQKADIFMFRWIFHDWSDKYCVQILRNLIPAMRSGTRVLIGDMLRPPIGTLPNSIERIMTMADLSMLTYHNSKERTLDELISVFKQANERYRYVNVSKPEGSTLSFAEFTFDA